MPFTGSCTSTAPRAHSILGRDQRRRLRAAGLGKEAADIIVISGPFPVDETGPCLWIKAIAALQRLSPLPHGKLRSWSKNPANAAPFKNRSPRRCARPWQSASLQILASWLLLWFRLAKSRPYPTPSFRNEH